VKAPPKKSASPVSGAGKVSVGLKFVSHDDTGLVIKGIVAGGAAQAAGIVAGDVVKLVRELCFFRLLHLSIGLLCLFFCHSHAYDHLLHFLHQLRVQINRKATKNKEDFLAVMKNLAPGMSVRVQILRGDKSMELRLNL